MARKKKIQIATDDEVNQYGKGEDAPNDDASREQDIPSEQHGEPDMQDGNDHANPQARQESDSRNEAEQWKDKYLRSKAELANYQRRMERDRQDSIRYAHAGLVRDLLPVLDDLERVIDASDQEQESVKAVVDGVRMVKDNFIKLLAQHQIKPIEALGQPFDPAVHEAMMEQPSDEHDERIVLQELAKGYKLHDRVLRPSKVIVSKPMEGNS